MHWRKVPSLKAMSLRHDRPGSRFSFFVFLGALQLHCGQWRYWSPALVLASGNWPLSWDWHSWMGDRHLRSKRPSPVGYPVLQLSSFVICFTCFTWFYLFFYLRSLFQEDMTGDGARTFGSFVLTVVVLVTQRVFVRMFLFWSFPCVSEVMMQLFCMEMGWRMIQGPFPQMWKHEAARQLCADACWENWKKPTKTHG